MAFLACFVISFPVPFINWSMLSLWSSFYCQGSFTVFSCYPLYLLILLCALAFLMLSTYLCYSFIFILSFLTFFTFCIFLFFHFYSCYRITAVARLLLQPGLLLHIVSFPSTEWIWRADFLSLTKINSSAPFKNYRYFSLDPLSSCLSILWVCSDLLATFSLISSQRLWILP